MELNIAFIMKSFSLLLQMVICADALFFERSNTIVDLSCGFDQDLGSVRSKSECAIMCKEMPGCRSFFHNPTLRYCRGVKSVHVNRSTSNCTEVSGSRYYVEKGVIGSSCTGDGDCYINKTECMSGICQCSPGYSLKDSTTCASICSTYGFTFIEYQGKVLNTYGGLTFYNLSLSECREKCFNFGCINFNYCAQCKVGTRCGIRVATPLSDPSSFEDNPLVNYYMRACADP